MIDIHTHILPGLDDGPERLEQSVAMAGRLLAAGTGTVVATPHVRADHPFPLERLEASADELRVALETADVELDVVAGAEVALTKAVELDESTLEQLCLGEGPYLLVESPYTPATGLLEQVLFDLLSAGLRPVLAHPERSPSFLSDIERLARLVRQGVLCSVTAGSMSGLFGGSVRDFSIRLFERRLVHDVASDAHGDGVRPLRLASGFESLERELPGVAAQAEWFTLQAPAALLAGEDLPARPPELRHTRRLSPRRLLRRR